MYYEKASAEVITFVNGSFIKTFDSDTPAGGADARSAFPPESRDNHSLPPCSMGFSHYYDHSFPLRSKAPKRMKQGASNAASRNLLEYA